MLTLKGNLCKVYVELLIKMNKDIPHYITYHRDNLNNWIGWQSMVQCNIERGKTSMQTTAISIKNPNVYRGAD